MGGRTSLARLGQKVIRRNLWTTTAMTRIMEEGAVSVSSSSCATPPLSPPLALSLKTRRNGTHSGKGGALSSWGASSTRLMSSGSSSAAMAAMADNGLPEWKTLTISGSGKGTTMTAQCGKHQVTTDQPVKLGGKDLGTDPMSMLLASLLGCEQYLVHVVAKDLGMNIHSTAYEVQGDYDLRGVLGVREVPSHFQRIRIKASVITKESEEKLAELAEIVQKRCPVSALICSAGIDLKVKFVKV